MATRVRYLALGTLAFVLLGLGAVGAFFAERSSYSLQRPWKQSVRALPRFVLGYPARLLRAATASDLVQFEYLAASQLGYGPSARKRFTSPKPFNAFTVVDDVSGVAVPATFEPPRSVSTDMLGGDYSTVWIGDFSAVTAPGRYRIVADNGMRSRPFNIGVDVFDPAIRAVQRSFYFQRAFTAIEERYAEGPWVHPDDSALAPAGIVKGWHDAGDFTLYNAMATSALFWLLEAYSDFHPFADDMNIPESGNGVPDLLDEARWELDWMLSMQDAASGGFHNVVCKATYAPYGRNPLNSDPPRDGGAPYRLGEVGTMATARAVGSLAYAASVFKPIDAAFAEKALAAALRGWDYLEARPSEHSDGPSCPAARQDGDAELGRQVRMYAAAGLLLATGNAEFDRAFARYDAPLVHEPSTYHTHAYAARVYLRAPAGAPERKAAITEQLLAQAEGMRQDAAQHPFEWSGHYFWGSVAAGFERGGGFGVPPCMTDHVAHADYCYAVMANIDYAFGRNIYQLSYLNGVPGVTNAHRRAYHHWLATLRATPFLFPGIVAGGPNTTPELYDVSVPRAPTPAWGYWDDPAMRRYDGTAIDARYTDNDSWSTNELDIVWQATALYNLYFAQWLARRPLP